MKTIFAVLLLASASSAFAFDDLQISDALQSVNQLNAFTMIDWKVGDSADYAVKVASFGNLGTMKKSITKDEGTAIWMRQEMNLLIKKELLEVLMDKSNGKILKYIHNGKEETPPNESVEVISQEYVEVTVPAGTFKSVHVVAKTTQVPKLDIWLNPTETPMDGMLKTVVVQQGTEINIELTKFARGQ